MSNQQALNNGCICEDGCAQCNRLADAYVAMREALLLFTSEIPLVRGNATGLWAYSVNWEEKARAALALADSLSKPIGD